MLHDRFLCVSIYMYSYFLGFCISHCNYVYPIKEECNEEDHKNKEYSGANLIKIA